MQNNEKEILEINDVSKTFKFDSEDIQILNNINLKIRSREIVTILGPSGCGKSTILRLIAGLDKEYDGQILLNGQSIKGPSVERGMAFQESRLFPWLTIEENIKFGLREDIGNDEKKIMVDQHIELVGLEEFKSAYPHQLSGGMQQRTSIARALVNNPEILLLDEPFGALDAMTRLNMQQEVLKIWQKEKITMILVTHDIEEAVFLADRIVVMSKRPGQIREVVDVNIKREPSRNVNEILEIKNYIYNKFFKD